MTRNELRDRARQVYREWRRALPYAERAELAAAPRAEQIVAKAVDPDARENAEWSAELAEYLTAHDLFWVEERRYHICRPHPAARAVIATGVVPARFSCPLASAACPIAAASGCTPKHLHVIWASWPATGESAHAKTIRDGRDSGGGSGTARPQRLERPHRSRRATLRLAYASRAAGSPNRRRTHRRCRARCRR